MSKQILILPGDGIGPEIMAEAVKVLNLANDKYNLGFELSHDVIGGAAIDQHGVPLADITLDLVPFRTAHRAQQHCVRRSSTRNWPMPRA